MELMMTSPSSDLSNRMDESGINGDWEKSIWVGQKDHSGFFRNILLKNPKELLTNPIHGPLLPEPWNSGELCSTVVQLHDEFAWLLCASLENASTLRTFLS